MSVIYCHQCHEHIDTDFGVCEHDDQQMLDNITEYDFEELWNWESDDDDVQSEITEHLKDVFPDEYRMFKKAEAEQLAYELNEQ